MDRLAIAALEGYAPEIGVGQWMLEDTRRRPLRDLAAVEPGMINWALTSSGHTICTLLYHVAAIEVDWVLTEVLEAESFPEAVVAAFPFDVREADGRLTPVLGIPLEAHVVRLEDTRRRTLEAFAEMSVAEYRRLRRFEDYEVTPEWVLHHLAQHEAEHRGQLGEIRLAAAARSR